MDKNVIIYNCAYDQAILELKQQGIQNPSEEQIKALMKDYYVLINKENL